MLVLNSINKNQALLKKYLAKLFHDRLTQSENDVVIIIDKANWYYCIVVTY